MHAISEPIFDQVLVDLLQSRQLNLIVVRSGEAEHNLKQTLSSDTSPGIALTGKGISQIKKCVKQLKMITPVDHIYTSPLFRAMQSAQIIGKLLNISHHKIKMDTHLSGQSFGTFEGKPYKAYRSYFRNPQQVFHEGVPEGESGTSLFIRLQSFLYQIAEKHEKETILLVTHGLNCCQINKCLKGYFGEQPPHGSYIFFNFLTEMDE